MKLALLDAPDLFDVLHVLYEEYMSGQSREHIEVRSAIRSVVYQNFYDQENKYDVSRASSQVDGVTTAGGDAIDAPVWEAADTSVPKPYIEPTNPERLSGIVGQPMG